MRRPSVRIVYGIQSTGKGYLSRFLGLKPFFDRDGHELMVIASGNVHFTLTKHEQI